MSAATERGRAAVAVAACALLIAGCSAGHDRRGAAPAESPVAGERSVAAGATAGPTSAPTATASAAPTSASGSGAATLPKHVVPVAGDPTTPAPTVVPNSAVPVPVAAPEADGCDHDYGVQGECIPLHAAGGAPVTCAYLAANHYLPLLVGVDSLSFTTRPGAMVKIINGQTYLTSCGT